MDELVTMLLQLPTVGGLVFAVVVLRDELREARKGAREALLIALDYCADDGDGDPSADLERRLNDLN